MTQRPRNPTLGEIQLPQYPVDKLDLYTHVSEFGPNLNRTVPLTEGGEAYLYRDGDKVYKAFKFGEELAAITEKNGEYVSETFVPSHLLMEATQNARLANIVFNRQGLLRAQNAAQLEIERLGLRDPRAYHPEVLRESYTDWRHLQRNASRLSYEIASLCNEQRIPVPPEFANGVPIIVSSKFRGGIPAYTSLILDQINGPLTDRYPQLAQLQLPKRLFPNTYEFGLIEENPWNADTARFGGRLVLSMEFVPHTLTDVIKGQAKELKDLSIQTLLKRNVTMNEQEASLSLPENLMPKLYRMQRLLKAWGIVHGDLKWDNIGIDTNGELVLLDASTMVAEGTIQDYATPEYFPPQLIPALKNLTHRATPATDYYALQVMHRQLAGQLLGSLAAALQVKTPDRLAASAANVVHQTERRAQRR